MKPEPRDPGSHPANLSPEYRSSGSRAPQQPLLPAQGIEPIDIPVGPLGSVLGTDDADLLSNARTSGEPMGERLIVAGRVLEGDGAPLAGCLVEIWQANAAGRYAHDNDQHDAPLDENFLGVGRTFTDREGGFRFLTLRPGAYPWGNHENAWRPPHIHFSVLGDRLEHRLVTQMYFPGDPLLEHDPIFQSVPDDARQRLIATFDLDLTEPDFALGFRFDVVVRGAQATPETP